LTVRIAEDFKGKPYLLLEIFLHFQKHITEGILGMEKIFGGEPSINVDVLIEK
jgi:hypothetical protein